jgi:hypothetical protein
MRKIIMTGVLCMLAVIFGSALAEAGQAPYTTSVKISCDNSVTLGSAIGVKLCTDTGCNIFVDVGDLECGSSIGMRSAGLRVESDFEPTVFKFTLHGFNESGSQICLLENSIMPVGSTVTGNGTRSPKLSVGRPH